MPPARSGRGPERTARGAFLLAVVAACDPASTRGADAAPSSEAGPDVPPPRAATATPALARCRVVMGEGAASKLELGSWVDLAAGASLVVREAATARELRYVGPARVLPCPADGVVLVAGGTVTAMPGSGEAPGNEQWVGTPCGVLRWTAGAHRVTVSEGACTARASGTLILAPAGDVTVAELASDPERPDASAGIGAARREGDLWRLDGRIAVRAERPLPARASEAARLSCERATAREAQAAALLLSPDAGARREATGPAGGDLGARTAAHVEARRAARTACAVWHARENGG